MSDTVFSVKIDEAVKGRFEELAQAIGTTQKNFFVRLVEAYETSQMRGSMTQVKEIEQLHHHLGRVEEIYIGLVKSSQDRQEADADKIARAEQDAQNAKVLALDTKKDAEKAINEALQQLEAYKAEAALARENAEKELIEMRDTVERALESREQSTRLATLAEEAAAAAKTKVAELETLANKADLYKKEAEQLGKKVEKLTGELVKAEAALQKLQEDSKSALDEMVVRMEEALQRAAERAELEKEKAILVTKTEAMEEIGKLREALAQIREEKAALEVQIARAGNQSLTSAEGE